MGDRKLTFAAYVSVALLLVALPAGAASPSGPGDAACTKLRMTSLGPVPDALLRACHLEPAAKVEGKPLDAVNRGPILVQEASTDTMSTTSVTGITTLTPFGNLNTGATDFPADVELLPSDPVRAYQLSSAGIVGSMDTSGVVTPLPNNPPPSGQGWSDMAVDPTSGIVYASASTCGTISTLSTLNLLGGASALVGTITNSTCVVGIAFSNAGVLYGFDIGSDSLLSIDKNTGVGTVVGPIGFDANFGQAMDCDPASGICYLFAFNNTTGRAELRSVDLTTGASTLVGVIGSASPGDAQAAGAVFGTIRTPCTVDADCADGDLCNGLETCFGNLCQAGTPVSCDDGFFCTLDVCDPPSGTCSHPPNPCSDSDACTVDTCDNQSGCFHQNACIQFCNAGAIAINDLTTATPYPSSIAVGGAGAVASVGSVVLQGFGHTYPDDVDVLLVGPGGQNATIMSDVGGSTPVSGLTLTLSDAAATPLPDGGPLASGTFQPANAEAGDTFPAPAPPPAGGSALSVFSGLNPNGTWKLFVVDDVGGDSGTFAGGWCLNIRVTNCTTNSDCNDGNRCNGTETCNNGQCIPGVPTGCDDGLFCTIDTCDPLDGECHHTPNPCSDNDACTDDTCDNANGCSHVFACQRFCSAGSTQIRDNTTALPYPSTVSVSGLSALGALGTVELNGLTHTFPADIDMLLVGPAGQNVTIMSDVGGGDDVVGINLVLSDGAATPLSVAGPLVSGTFRPNNSGAGDTFAAPAPPPSGAVALSTFDGANPNGSWALYVVDDVGQDAGTLSQWCVNIRPISLCANVVCTPLDQCHDAGTCDPSTGLCSHPAKPDGGACDDHNTCTNADACQNGECYGVPNSDPCDDGNPCTIADVCANRICAGTPLPGPPEIQNVRFAADKQTLSWSPSSGASVYDVVVGSVAALPVGPGGGDETCFGDNAGISAVLPAIPPPGQAYWYLVRGENSCGSGGYGFGGLNGVPSGPRQTATCDGGILHPAAGSVICGETDLIGSDPDPSRPVANSTVTWDYSLNGTTYNPIAVRPLAPDSRGLPGATTFWDPAGLPSGPVFVRLTTVAPSGTRTWVSSFILNRPPVNGSIQASFDSGSGLTTLSAPAATDSDGVIVNYRWLLGDSVTLAGPTATHAYLPGDYVVYLETTDNTGCQALTTVQYGSPPSIPVSNCTVVDYCDPISIDVNMAWQGNASNNWPEDKRDKLPKGKHPLGQIHNANIAVAYNFEVVAKVIGNPALCTEFQLIKSSYDIELADGTRRLWENPAGGVGAKFHPDNYTKPFTWKTHTPNADGTASVAWIDDPRIYTTDAYGGTYDATTNPIAKAKIQNEVLVELDGQEAPFPHVETGGPGETVYKRFKLCASWNLGPLISVFSLVDEGGPDAAPPAPAQIPSAPTGWGAGPAGALTNCN